MEKLLTTRTRLLLHVAIVLISLLAKSSSYPQAGDGNDIINEAEENFDNCGEPYFGSESPKEVPDGLARMGPNSKYFILSGTTVQIKEVASKCDELGLQPAEIRNIFELIAVESFITASNMEVTVSLGLNDEKKEGYFVEYDGTPMSFHAFAEGQPDNEMNMESCVLLREHQNRLVYLDVKCDEMVTPMCMFKSTDRCFLSSPLSLAVVPGGFSYVGSSPARDYYVGLNQLTRSKAQDACTSMGYKLVDFSTGLNNNQQLYALLEKWLQIHFLHPKSAFWTGGKIVPSIDGKDPLSTNFVYQFEASGKLLRDLSDWPSLQWANGEPMDNSGIGMDQCISATLTGEVKPSDNIFTIYTQNCRIPLYPLCYKSKVQESGGGGDSGNETSTRSPATAENYCPLDNIELDLSTDRLSVDEMWKLSVISRLKALDSDDFRFKFSQERPWLTNFIDLMFRTARRAVPGDLVPSEFTNIIHNLMILYYNAASDAVIEPSELHLEQIQNETNFLAECMDQIKVLNFGTLGGVPVRYNDKRIAPIAEMADSKHQVIAHLDLVLDSFWYHYLIAIGSCFPQSPSSQTEWLYRIHYLFVKYFLNPFQERWLNVDTEDLKSDYGVIFGDMDLDQTYYSMKTAAVAAFVQSDIVDLYFPRPVYIQTNLVNKEIMNQKVILTG